MYSIFHRSNYYWRIIKHIIIYFNISIISIIICVIFITIITVSNITTNIIICFIVLFFNLCNTFLIFINFKVEILEFAYKLKFILCLKTNTVFFIPLCLSFIKVIIFVKIFIYLFNSFFV